MRFLHERREARSAVLSSWSANKKLSPGGAPIDSTSGLRVIHQQRFGRTVRLGLSTSNERQQNATAVSSHSKHSGGRPNVCALGNLCYILGDQAGACLWSA